ncbi:MAG TPA: pilus assembly PilX N-terminal domain-containing protein [Pyrinomonadaceae bacterium]|nr:pilus assembly PilX N-terminal domain-containing protein [Pyrinomonadaceae bacterium]
MKSDDRRTSKNEQGAALVIALVGMLVLGVLTAGLIFVTRTETLTTANYTTLAQARYAAEAGVQNTINWLSNNYTPPANFSSYNTSTAPVRCTSGCASSNQRVVLSGVSDVTSNYPDSTVANAYQSALRNQSLTGLPGASFSTYATLLTMTPGTTPSWLAGGGTGAVAQTWQITSRGNIGGVRTATVEVVATYERISSPLVTYALFGTSPTCGSVMFSGGGGTNSFDSSLGTYLLTQQANSGNVGSNGNTTLNGNGQIAGIIESPKTGTGTCSSGTPNALTPGSGWTTGGLNQLSAPVTYPNPSPPDPTPTTTIQSINSSCSTISGCSCYPLGGFLCAVAGPYQLAPGTYGNLTLSGGKILHLSAGTYRINSITVSGNAPIIIDSGPVILNIAAQGIASGTCCAADLSGGSVTNLSGIPLNFQVVYGGGARINMAGGSGAYGVVYAPNSPLTISGGADWYGAILGSTVNNSGGTAIHFDRALVNQLTSSTSGFRNIGFSWSKF